ncbi:MAG: anti-sigma factor [Myxococcales bacterium]|nr:anti-sigma factor [Myxococcales bacterium]
MTEAEFLDRVETWALGGLTDLERAAMERYLADAPTPACQAAHARAFATTALLAAALPPAAPAPEVWARIERALPPAPRRAAPTRVPPWLGWAVATVAVAAAVLLWLDRDRRAEREAGLIGQVRARDTALAAATSTRSDLDACRRDLTELRARDLLADEAVALLELPGTQLIPLDRRGPAARDLAANAIYHRGVKRAYVVAANIPADAPVDGYQVWLVRGGQRVAAGTLVPDRGRAIVSIPTLTLDDGVPETFQLALASGEIVLESQIRI